MPSPYLPNTDADRAAMLQEIGANSVDELFHDVPVKSLNAVFKLPQPLSELELSKELRQLADRNANLADYTCFLGAGFYHHFVPAVVGHITGRSEFYTAYTPYQPEISQGTLQAIYEYQSLVCQLTGMDVSNAGMYDGSSAAAEAVLMACRVTGRSRAAVLSTINPGYISVIKSYLTGRDIGLEVMAPGSLELSSDHACLVIQQPNFYGYFEDTIELVRKAHQCGALLVTAIDPISLGLFRPPADYGVDIVVGEGQALGSPVSFGGPALGLFACRNEYLRQMPGRLVGRTIDRDGKPGFVLTIATREQHIRRERATSNICTNEAMLSLAAAVYLAALGKNGLRQVAELCYHKAHYAANAINSLKGYSLTFDLPFFKEFTVRCPVPSARLNRALYEEKIIGGLDISPAIPNGMLLCVTEMHTRHEIDRLVEVLARFQGVGNEPA